MDGPAGGSGERIRMHAHGTAAGSSPGLGADDKTLELDSKVLSTTEIAHST